MQLSLLLKASVLHYKNDTRKGNGSRGNFEILKSIKNKPLLVMTVSQSGLSASITLEA